MSNCKCNCHQPYVVTDADMARFWAKLEKSEGCWNWIGSKNRQGYGTFGVGGRQVRVNRFIYEVTFGAIEPGLLIDHICRNRGCARPSHLRTVTPAENVQNQDGHSDSRSGRRGVDWRAAIGKWRASAQVGGKRHYAGHFSDLEEAAEAARQLRLSLHTHNDADRIAS